MIFVNDIENSKELVEALKNNAVKELIMTE
jgi:hypothetical protein